MPKLSIRNTITVGALTILLLIAGQQALTVYQISQIRISSARLARVYAQTGLLLSLLSNLVLRASLIVRDANRQEDQEQTNALVEEVRRVQQEITGATERLESNNLLPQERMRWERIRIKLHTFDLILEQVLWSIEQSDRTRAAQLITEQLAPSRQEISNELAELTLTHTQLWAEASEQVQSDISRFLITNSLVVLAVLLLASVVFGWVRHIVGHLESALVEKNSALDTFARTVSHDLRNPLAAVLVNIDLLERQGNFEPGSEPALTSLRIRKSLNRMNNLISDLLTLASAGMILGHQRPVDLVTLASAVADDLDKVLQERQGEIKLHPDLPLVLGDPERLRQVFQNLFDNAVKYARPDVPLVIEVTPARQNKDWAEIAVTDNGRGIPSNALPHIFEPFVRHVGAIGGQEAPKGTGVGLAIVRRIVQAHGGQIRAESEEGKGTTFTITLKRPPQAQAEASG